MITNSVKRVILSIAALLLIAIQAFGQENPNLEFQPLDTLKSVNYKQLQSQYKVFLKTNDPNFFVVQQQETRYLAQKVGQNKWVIYDLEYGGEINNVDRLQLFPLSKYDMLIGFSGHRGNATHGNIIAQDYYVLVDVKRHSMLELTSHFDVQRQDTPEQKPNETDSEYEKRIDSIPFHTNIYDTEIKITGSYLSMKSKCKIDAIRYTEPFNKKIQQIAEGDVIAPGGIYRYVNGVFVKIKTYKPGFKGLQPIKQ